MTIRLTMLLAAIGSLYVAPAIGGPLAIDTNSYFSPEGAWHGSTPFQTYVDYPLNTITGSTAGYIDWAVYAPGQFPAGFVGYTPDPAEFVYAYQIFLTSPSMPDLVATVSTENPTHNVGSFTGDGGFGQVSGVAPSLLGRFDYLVYFEFDTSALSGASTGLVFTSLNFPKLLDGAIFDAEAAGTIVPLPSPDWLPEPSSFVLAALGLIGLASWGWRRKR